MGVCAGDNGPEFDATVARGTSALQDLLATPPADTTGGPRSSLKRPSRKFAAR